MHNQRKLRAVPDDTTPLDMGPDIYAADKAKRESIDWNAMWIRGDRAAAVELPARVRRPWRA